MDSDFKRGLWYGLFSPTPVLPMSWWWEFFEERGMFYYIGHVREILNHMMEAGKGEFEEVLASSLIAETFALKCGRNKYVYLYNSSSPAMMVSLNVPELNRGEDYSLCYFDCEAGTYHAIDEMRLDDDGTLTLPGIQIAANSDIVLIISERD
jgi:hypothetical protein